MGNSTVPPVSDRPTPPIVPRWFAIIATKEGVSVVLQSRVGTAVTATVLIVMRMPQKSVRAVRKPTVVLAIAVV